MDRPHDKSLQPDASERQMELNATESSGRFKANDVKVNDVADTAAAGLEGQREDGRKTREVIQSQARNDNNHSINSKNKKKRGMKPRSQRNRKRPRGGGRVGETSTSDAEKELQIEVLPLMSNLKSVGEKVEWKSEKRIRVVRPYPFTFATFAKARWIGRPVIDVYHEEFGSYPKSYYESAINEGRILVSGKQVTCEYKIKGQDELSHTVHRHEPAVAVSDKVLATTTGQRNGSIIKILHEDADVIVVDKPSTLPIHPCGGYNFNSLFHILSCQDPSLKGKLHTVHRLDRLTSGLTLIAKSTNVAKKLAKCITDREHCHKVYLARVKGKFPLETPADMRFSEQEKEAPCFYGELVSKLQEEAAKGKAVGKAALGFWISDAKGVRRKDATLQDVFDSKRDTDQIVHELATAASPADDVDSGKNLWFHLACPCRIVSPKNGVCEAGDFKGLDEEQAAKSVKPAQTSFAVVAYDAKSDSTVVVAKPATGRTHQIRLHLQYLGHPIANDPNYGGELWYDDPDGERACKEARRQLDAMDRSQEDAINATKEEEGAAPVSAISRPENAISTDIPATEDEIRDAAANKPREEGESLTDFVKKTCVWCARSRGGDRTVLEFLVRSRGIWLHALQYSLVTGESSNERLCFRTEPPLWSVLNIPKINEHDGRQERTL